MRFFIIACPIAIPSEIHLPLLTKTQVQTSNVNNRMQDLEAKLQVWAWLCFLRKFWKAPPSSSSAWWSRAILGFLTLSDNSSLRIYHTSLILNLTHCIDPVFPNKVTSTGSGFGYKMFSHHTKKKKKMFTGKLGHPGYGLPLSEANWFSQLQNSIKPLCLSHTDTHNICFS